MSVQSEITRIANAKTALATAIEGKGVTVPEGTKLDGMAALVEAIQAGGGTGIDFPTGYKVSAGTYTPNTEGTNVLHTIKIASSVPYNLPIRMFCIYREDGFDASGSDAARYLTFYAGAIAASGEATSGVCIYRSAATSGTFVGGGGGESNGSYSYGLPSIHNSTNRKNCFVRRIADDGVLTFSSYGIVTLESGKTYKWFALLSSDAEV